MHDLVIRGAIVLDGLAIKDRAKYSIAFFLPAPRRSQTPRSKSSRTRTSYAG
jgi:hypothetical protein